MQQQPISDRAIALMTEAIAQMKAAQSQVQATNTEVQALRAMCRGLYDVIHEWRPELDAQNLVIHGLMERIEVLENGGAKMTVVTGPVALNHQEVNQDLVAAWQETLRTVEVPRTIAEQATPAQPVEMTTEDTCGSFVELCEPSEPEMTPVAVVSPEVADAFNMRGLPNVRVEQPTPSDGMIPVKVKSGSWRIKLSRGDEVGWYMTEAQAQAGIEKIRHERAAIATPDDGLAIPADLKRQPTLPAQPAKTPTPQVTPSWRTNMTPPAPLQKSPPVRSPVRPSKPTRKGQASSIDAF